MKPSVLMLSAAFLVLAGTQARAMVLGDFDHDGDVDSADFGHFKTCALGAAIPQTAPACIDARLDADPDVDLDDFGAFQRCYSGAGHPADPNCGCPSGQTDCNGTCTSTASDEANCGACGNTCATGLVCNNGSCASCPVGSAVCGGTCVNLDFDNGHCGSCGHACHSDEVCIAGVCHQSEPCWDCGGG